MFLKTVYSLTILTIVFSCKETPTKTADSIPTIQLLPEKAETLKLSDYFDRVEALWLKGSLYDKIEDFIELNEGYLTKIGENKEFQFFTKEGIFSHSFGKAGRGPGEYLFASNPLQLGKDGLLRIIGPNQYLEYNLEGETRKEKQFQYKSDSLNPLTSPKYLLNDSLLVLQTRQSMLMSIQPQQEEMLKRSSWIQLYSIETGNIIASYFPWENTYHLNLHNQLYLFKDSLRYYYDKDGSIYSLFPRQTVRYRINKGPYDQLQTMEELQDAIRKRITNFKRIDIKSCNETERYIIGEYLFKGQAYTFIYDKQSQQTRNFRMIENDFLGITGERKEALFQFKTGLSFKENCVWLTLGRDFAEWIENIKAGMSTEKWKEFEFQHPEFIRIYQEFEQMGEALEEETPIILLRYYFN